MSLEFRLKDLNLKAKNLLRYIHYSNEPDIQESLENVYRQSVAIEYLINHYVIAITGLQGVGKSTLMKEIYDIPNNIIPINTSVGEKIPVLISETENKSDINKAYKHFINEENELEKKEIPIENFEQIAMDPDSNIVFLQIKTKYKVFKSEDISFLLLPGFELEKDEFYQIIESYLFASAFCIFVTNATNYANDENRERLEKTIKTFEENRPLIILTNTKEDGNQQLKKTVIEDLKNINEERIICSGTFSDNPNGGNWREDFINSVNKYKKTKMSFRREQVKNLRKTINNYRNLWGKLDGVIRGLSLDFNITQYSNVNKVIKLFEDSAIELKVKYLKNIKLEIDKHKSEVSDIITSNIINKSIWKKFLNLFFTSSLKEKEEIIREVKHVWNNEKKLQKKITGAINRTLKDDKIIKGYKIYDALPDYSNGITELQLLEVQGAYDPKIIDNLRTILINKEQTDKSINEEYFKSIQIAPRLLLEYIRINTLFPDILQYSPDSKDKPEKNLGDTLIEQAEYNKNLLTGIAVRFGINSLDGEIDSFKAFTKLLEVGKVTSPYLNIFEGLFITGSAAIAIIKHLNKHDIDKNEISKQLTSQIGEKYFEEMENIFDQSMEDFIKLLKIKLEDRYKIGVELAKHENLLKAHRDLKYSLDGIQESLVDS